MTDKAPRAEEAPRVRLRDPAAARRAAARPEHRRPRGADLPDDQLRVRGPGIGGGLLQPAGVREQARRTAGAGSDTTWAGRARRRRGQHTLQEFPRHCAMLLVRTGDGVAELHENFADLFYVLDGRAALVTGGVVAGAQSVGPGETRGSGIEGGARQELRTGDVAHVPAGLPHQMLVAAGQTVTCLVMKIQEKP